MRCRHFCSWIVLGCLSKEGLPEVRCGPALQPDNHWVPCNSLCPDLKHKAFLELGNQVGGGRGPEISGGSGWLFCPQDFR